jgi:hypothetical protein
MKKKHKIQFDCHQLEIIIPGASKLEVLPRKQKKALKKKISIDLLKYIDDNSEELIKLIESKKIND